MAPIPKNKPYRDKKYTDWVKSQPSVISGQPADDAHHLIGHCTGGMGTKVSDLWTLPLTRQEHQEIHQIGHKSWEHKYGSQWKFVAQTLAQYVLTKTT